MRRSIRHLALVAPIALLVLACEKKPAAAPVTIEQATFAPALDVQLAASTKTATGLYYRDLTVGTGAEAAAGQQVSVHYRGALIDGKEFDANGASDKPFQFRLGGGEVIGGWDQGVAGMKVGGKRQLIIPPALGYGETGTGPIPGNAILVFTVELLEVH
jgi:FKBP-type peptidyl-prolyl cis-trans isomerase